jgi:crossover junction endodeoxyribonuclease RuvC
MALTGYGRAEKRQVQEMVKIILGLSSSKERLSEDQTDALALCICHINSSFELK